MIHSSCIAFPSYNAGSPLEKHDSDLGESYQSLKETLTFALHELDLLGRYHAAIHLNTALMLLFGEDWAIENNNDSTGKCVVEQPAIV